MEITGRVKLVREVQQISSTFKKRELIVTTDEQYPQHIMVEFTQDKTDLLNSFQPGEQVRVDINLRGREWINPQGQAVYFNTIQGWRIDRVQQEVPSYQQPQSPAPGAPMSQMPPAATFEPIANFNEEEIDDLPF